MKMRLAQALTDALGEGRVAVDEIGATVHPADLPQLAKAMELAALHKKSVGVGLGADTTVRVDLGRLADVLHIDETSLLVHAQAGISVGELQAQLADKGLTLGTLPAALSARTLGAALAAPRPSEMTPRGPFLDACAAIDVVLPGGTLCATHLAPRKASGPDLMHAVVGSRGQAGVIAGAWLRLSRVAPRRENTAWQLRDDTAALAVARAFFDRGGRPAALRILASLLWVELDGVEDLVEAERALLTELAEGKGGARRDPPDELPVITPGDVGHFLSQHELAAAWAARPQGAWLSALSAAGGCLMASGKAPILDEGAEGLRAALVTFLASSLQGSA